MVDVSAFPGSLLLNEVTPQEQHCKELNRFVGGTRCQI